MEVSPPIQFRIEWADSQGMSPLLGCRPILIAVSGYPSTSPLQLLRINSGRTDRGSRAVQNEPPLVAADPNKRKSGVPRRSPSSAPNNQPVESRRMREARTDLSFLKHHRAQRQLRLGEEIWPRCVAENDQESDPPSSGQYLPPAPPPYGRAEFDLR